MEGFGNTFFIDAIECGSGLVEEYDLRILEYDLGDSKALFLSSGELHSALSDFGFEPVFELRDEFAFREFYDLIYMGLQSIAQEFFFRERIGQVLENLPVKYIGFLGQVSDVVVVRLERNI